MVVDVPMGVEFHAGASDSDIGYITTVDTQLSIIILIIKYTLPQICCRPTSAMGSGAWDCLPYAPYSHRLRTLTAPQYGIWMVARWFSGNRLRIRSTNRTAELDCHRTHSIDHHSSSHLGYYPIRFCL
jgi:hypothetical protein